MTCDAQGQPLEIGDEVIVRFKVRSISGNDDGRRLTLESIGGAHASFVVVEPVQTTRVPRSAPAPPCASDAARSASRELHG